jgi:hypothetical protein
MRVSLGRRGRLLAVGGALAVLAADLERERAERPQRAVT